MEDIANFGGLEQYKMIIKGYLRNMAYLILWTKKDPL